MFNQRNLKTLLARSINATASKSNAALVRRQPVPLMQQQLRLTQQVRGFSSNDDKKGGVSAAKIMSVLLFGGAAFYFARMSQLDTADSSTQTTDASAA